MVIFQEFYQVLASIWYVAIIYRISLYFVKFESVFQFLQKKLIQIKFFRTTAQITLYQTLAVNSINMYAQDEFGKWWTNLEPIEKSFKIVDEIEMDFLLSNAKRQHYFICYSRALRS